MVQKKGIILNKSLSTKIRNETLILKNDFGYIKIY